MTKAGFRKSDWFLGVAVAVSVVLFKRLSDLIPRLELKACDLGAVAASRAPSDQIAVIAIDGESLANPGRYQAEKELGKGAMGVVYQDKDPKIGRVVAIKTMAPTQGFEADEFRCVRLSAVALRRQSVAAASSRTPFFSKRVAWI
jgi:hypothetical protein